MCGANEKNAESSSSAAAALAAVSRSKRAGTLLARASCAAALLATSGAALADTFSWDGGTVDIATPGDGASAGGPGDWSTGIANWDNGTAHVAWPSTGTDNDAVFGGTVGIVTLTTPISVNDLTFNTNNYLINGTGANILTLNGTTPTITTPTGFNSTFSAQIAGSVGLTKAGPALLVLTGANTYTGATTINEGTLRFGAQGTTGSIAVSSPITVNTAATLTFQRTDTITQGVDFGSIAGVGTLAHAGTGGTLVLNQANTGFSGPISLTGAGSVLAVGNNDALGVGGLLNINNATTPTIRSTDATARTIANPTSLGSSTIFGSSGTGNLLFTGTSTVGTLAKTFTVLNARTEFSNVIVGTGAAAQVAAKAGPGLLVFSGANTYTQSTTVSGGTLALEGAGSIASSPALVVNNSSTLRLANTAAANNLNRLSNTATLNLGGGTFVFAHDAAAATNYSETLGNVTVSGGTNTVSTSQAAPGQTSILTFGTLTRTAGTINFSGAGLGIDARNRVLLTGQAAGNLGAFATYNGTDHAAYNATDGVTAATYTDIDALGGVIPNTAAAAVRIQTAAGSGNITLAAADTTITTLLQNTTTAATATLAGQTLRTSGILIPTGKQALTIGTAVDSGTMTFNVSVAGANLTLINNSTNPLTINSIVGNNGANAASLTVAGSGTVVSNGTNSYTGSTTVTDGTLTLNGARTAAHGAISVGTTVGSTGTLNVANGTYALAANNLFVGSGNTGAIGTLNQSGGTVSFTGGNQVLVGNGFAAGVYDLSGGTLQGPVTATLTRGVILGVNSGSTATFNLSGSGIVNMPLAILQVGRSDSVAAGTTSLFNQTGGTATFGNLSIGGSGSSTGLNSTVNWMGGTFSATGAFTFLAASANSTATLNIGGTADVTLPAFPTARGAGATATINFNGGTLRNLAASATYMGGLDNAFVKAGGAKFDTTNGSITVSQALLADAVSLGGGLTKAGTNALTLTGASTYTGPTAVSAGTLLVNGSLSSSSAVTVALGTTLGGSGTVGGSVSVAGTLAPGNSPGSLDVGSLALASTANTAMEIKGTTLDSLYDNVNILAGAPASTFGGALNVTPIDGYDLNAAEASYSLFTIADGELGGLVGGNFASVTVNSVGLTSAGDVWTGNSGSLTYSFSETTGVLSVVPEPGSFGLLGVAAIGLLRRRRR